VKVILQDFQEVVEGDQPGVGRAGFSQVFSVCIFINFSQYCTEQVAQYCKSGLGSRFPQHNLAQRMQGGAAVSWLSVY
jgi:hypothetical protein